MNKVYVIESFHRENPLEKVPEGWRVYNAPRPLPGHRSWTGNFRHGIFYVGIDPSHKTADILTQQIEDLDGWEVTFIPWSEIEEHFHNKVVGLRAAGHDMSDVTIDDFTTAELVSMWSQRS